MTAVCFSAPAYSKVCLRVYLWTARQHHSFCTLGLGVGPLFGWYI